MNSLITSEHENRCGRMVVVNGCASPRPALMRWTQFVGMVLGFIISLAIPDSALGAFGLTTNADNYAVDTGAGLVFKVRLATINNQQKVGDLMSLIYNGVEYQDQSKGSQINSGMDFLAYSNNNVTVTAQVVNTNFIVVTCTAANLVHYYIARNGYPHIYMATWFNVEPVTGGGLCRYIVRANQSLLPNGPRPSDNTTTTYTVEASDIFGMPDGETRSKHYSNHRLLDWFCTGATGSGVGAFMMRDLQEGGSGGPFFRCLINQGSGDQEIYEIVNYGENQTEAFRLNILNGPYTLVFNNGQIPAAPLDNSWLETAGLNLVGWVSATNRGVVTGTVTGVPDGFQTVVGFANTNAQYWAIATNGVYTTPRMIPGTYNVTLYKQEYAVATTTTTVSAGVTNTVNLASTEANPAFVFKLGEWDGTAAGFLNADKMTCMHPSDVRMSSWATTDFTVENNPTTQFPCIQARQENGTLTIRFNLTAAQAAAAHTVRIGMTTDYNGGRPNITVNSWTSALQGAPNEPNSRTFTTGSYRGNNVLYSYSVPASAFVTGQNVMYISIISGSGDLGGWLSAGWVYDCVQMDGTPSAPLPPSNIAAAFNPSQVSLSWPPVFNAVGYKIKRSTTHGGPYTAIATNVVASFNDTNLVAATRYYYVITSTNSAGESTNSTEVAAGVEPALMAYLPFDENSGTNAADATGNGWDGTLLSGAGWNPGKYGSAASFNGTSNYVSLPTGIVSGLGDFSIAAWVNQTSVSTFSRIFDFGNSTTAYMMLTPRATSGSGTIRFAITVGSSAGEQQINGPSALPTGWHHVAVTHQGSVGILYVDGVAVGTNNAMTLKPSDLSQPLGSNPTLQNYLGKSQWSDPYLNGRVDDFRIYNGALSVSQISALVSSPPFAPANFTATVVAANQVNLKWNIAPGAVDYSVLRSTSSGGPYTTIASGLTATNYSDTSVISGTTYYYVVAAVDTVGAGINSAEAVAVIPAPIWTGGGGDNNWTTGLNWLGGFVPSTSGAGLIFAGGTRTTPGMDASFSVSGLTFSNNASSFNLGTANASTLTLAGGMTNNSLNPQTLNVPIVLGATATLNAAAGNLILSNSLNKAGNLLTVIGATNTVLSGPISGSGSLFKQGSGVLTVATNATWDLTQASSGGFSGPLIAQAGTLTFNNGGSNYVNGELVIGGVVANGGAGNDAKIVVDNARLNIAAWLSLGRGNGVGGVSSDLVASNAAVISVANFSAGFNGGSGLNLPKGSISLNGASTFTVAGNGTFYVGESAGSDMTMTLSSSAQVVASGTGAHRIGAGGNGVLNVNDSSTVNLGGALDVGYVSGSGTVNLNGGSISTIGSGVTAIARSTAAGNTEAGTFSVNGGTFNSAGDLVVGLGGASTGTMTIGGGAVNVGTTGLRWLILGQYDMVQGQLNLTNNGSLNLWNNTAIRFTTAGGGGTNAVNQSGGTVTFYSDNGSTVGGAGVLDLAYAGAATARNTYNLDGGTLILPQVLSSSATPARIFNFNGGTLKPNGSSPAFMNLGTGNAVANVRNGGAIIDTTNFNITIGQALVHSGVAGDNAVDGGLTKSGGGTLTLTNANTYTGPTIITGGALALGGSGSIASSPSISISHGATLNVSGLTSSFVLGASQTLQGNGTVTGATTILGTLAPGAAIGTLTFGTAPALSGKTLMEINRTNAPAADKLVLGSGTLNFGGTLTVTNVGGPLQAGDSFQMFSASSYGGNFAATNLPALGSGLAWNNSLAVNGTIDVVSLVSLVPTNLVFAVSGTNLTLSWPADHTGWRLQMQTNSLGQGLGTNWVTVTGSTNSNQAIIPIILANPSAFFRLVYP